MRKIIQKIGTGKGSHCCGQPDPVVLKHLELVCRKNVEELGTAALECCHQGLVEVSHGSLEGQRVGSKRVS